LPSSSSFCEEYGIAFHDLDDRSRWYELCMEQLQLQQQPPPSDGDDVETDNRIRSVLINVTTKMAIEECDRYDNPRSATDEWITHMNMSNQRVTFDCFHIPDDPDGTE
jgi:hypothetical protein